MKKPRLASRKGKSSQKTAGSRTGPLPDREEILDFIRKSQGKVGKREIAKAFGIKGQYRVQLKALLRDMIDDGLIAGDRKVLRQPGAIPQVTVYVITGRDDDGELIGRPERWEEDSEPPAVAITISRKSKGAAPGIGARVLAKLDEDAEDARKSATVIKVLESRQLSAFGIVRHHHGGSVIQPVDRKQKELPLSSLSEHPPKSGTLVEYDIRRGGRFGRTEAVIREVVADVSSPKAISLIAIHSKGIPSVFPAAVLKAAEAATLPPDKSREDMTDIPFLTIDPADARDHDDAIFAEPLDEPDIPEGIRIYVAIADVAAYVLPGSPLDREALLRGNSVYLPDRVVPMLPERISNDLCSLREKENRPALVAIMEFDRNGRKKRHMFKRAMIRVESGISYEEAQNSHDGAAAIDGAVGERILPALYDAFSKLEKGRDDREPLDLDVPETKIILDGDGEIADVTVPARLDAHRLVEEFMIQANVAAAESLEGKSQALIYRIHDSPSLQKMEALRVFLKSLDFNLPKSGALRASRFNGIIQRFKGRDTEQLVQEVVLRSQSQAEYSDENIGHFGLNLRRYAHFTSPIRRYADLVVHRALITALGLGKGGLRPEDEADLGDIARTISDAERRAVAAERETVSRMVTRHLAEHTGAVFDAKISGVTSAGLFLRLEKLGADGFVPVSTLGNEYFVYDADHHRLTGEDTRLVYQLGGRVKAELLEAEPVTGSLTFAIRESDSKRAERKPVRRAGRKTSYRRSAPARAGRRRR